MTKPDTRLAARWPKNGPIYHVEGHGLPEHDKGHGHSQAYRHREAVPMTDLVPLAPNALAAVEIGPAERLAEWLAGLSPNTRRAYEHDLEQLGKFLGVASAGAAIAALCATDKRTALVAVERFRQSRIDAGLSPAAINRPISTIKSALRHLAKADFGPGRLDVDGVPMERVKDARGPEPGELARVISRLAADSDPRSVRDLAIVRLAAQRGLRRSEICGLDLPDFDAARSEIRIKRKGKTQKAAVRIPEQTRLAIEKWLVIRAGVAREGEAAMFVTITPRPDQTGLRLSAGALFRMVKQLGCGATAWRPHGLRHTAITTALRRTNNLEAARVLAGHAKVATTQLYLDDSAGMESLAVAAMEGDFK